MGLTGGDVAVPTVWMLWAPPLSLAHDCDQNEHTNPTGEWNEAVNPDKRESARARTGGRRGRRIRGERACALEGGRH